MEAYMDINFFVEHCVKGVWKRVPDKKGPRSPYYALALNEKTKRLLDKKIWDPGRHSALFGLLAGEASDVFLPFIEPRGLPDNVSAEIKTLFEEKKHFTPHYLNLTELLAVQDTVEDIPCYLNVEQFCRYKKDGKIPEGDHYTFPRGADLVSMERMTRIMHLSSLFDPNGYWCKVDNKKSFKEICPHFWVDILGAMQKINKDPAKVRCVFWFSH